MKDTIKLNFKRRSILSLIIWFMGYLFLKPLLSIKQVFAKDFGSIQSMNSNQVDEGCLNSGCSADGHSDVYSVKGGTPEKNMENLLQMMGGIENLVGDDDIIVLKPNAQWWNQGMTNTDAMASFIQAVLDRPGFTGEIIIADNQQYATANSRAWVTKERNGKFNYNELVEYFQNAGHKNVTKYHWQCAGPNPDPLQGDASSASNIVKGPQDGDGYVWRDDLLYVSPLGRKCMMTYPVFTSSYSGITIDFMNGAWKDGKYLDNLVRFVNFSALNHHSVYCGATASIKNYMGIVDMTCGFHGITPKGYWNTHYVGIRLDKAYSFINKLPWRIRKEVNGYYRWKYFSHTGGALGTFMKKIRIADLNIVTAHWVGYASRIDKRLSGHPKALLASTDPVALDLVASKKILVPLTISKKPGDKWLRDINDGSNEKGPFYRFIKKCHEQGIGNIDHHKIRVHEDLS